MALIRNQVSEIDTQHCNNLFYIYRTITYIPSNSAIDTQRRSLVAGRRRLRCYGAALHAPTCLRCYGVALRLAGSTAAARRARQNRRREAGSGAGGARLRHSAPARPAPLPLPACAGATAAVPLGLGIGMEARQAGRQRAALTLWGQIDRSGGPWAKGGRGLFCGESKKGKSFF